MLWQKDAQALHLNVYSIPTEGAFVYNTGM